MSKLVVKRSGFAGAARSFTSNRNSGLRRKFVRNAALAACAFAGCLFAATSARAGYTPIQAPPSGEANHSQILAHLYGGTFLGAGVDYIGSGGIVAHRIEDFISTSRGLPDPLPLVMDDSTSRAFADGPQNFTDQQWLAENVTANARARFATFSNEFGYLNGTSGMAFNKLFWTSGGGYDVGGNNTLIRNGSSIFRWARDGDQGVLSSQQGDNSDTRDHMVTYQILSSTQNAQGGVQNSTTYLLFWEDTRAVVTGKTADFDYNDMVVEIKAVSTLVPEPTTAGALAAATGLGLLRRRNRK